MHVDRRRLGRPGSHGDAQILTLVAAQNLWQMSFRDALAVGGRLFGDVPALSAYHYRAKVMPEDLTGEFITFVSGELTKKTPHEVRSAVADGTGFSYDNLCSTFQSSLLPAEPVLSTKPQGALPNSLA